MDRSMMIRSFSRVAGWLEDGLEHWAVVGVLPVAEHPADELLAEFVLRCLPGGDDLVEEALRRCGGGVEEAFLGVVVVIDEGWVDVGGAGDRADSRAGVAAFGERRSGFPEDPGGEHAAFVPWAMRGGLPCHERSFRSMRWRTVSSCVRESPLAVKLVSSYSEI